MLGTRPRLHAREASTLPVSNMSRIRWLAQTSRVKELKATMHLGKVGTSAAKLGETLKVLSTHNLAKRNEIDPGFELTLP